jgi:hypothetical protein
MSGTKVIPQNCIVSVFFNTDRRLFSGKHSEFRIEFGKFPILRNETSKASLECADNYKRIILGKDAVARAVIGPATS